MFLNAFTDWWRSLSDQTSSFIMNRGLDILAGIFGIIFAIIFIKVLKTISKRLLNKSRLDKTVTGFLTSLITAILYLMLIYIIAATFGIPMDSFLALSAAAGVALGFALQNALSNIAGGMIILMNKPFKVGDFVTINSVEGKVSIIRIFTTELITIDNKVISVPNNSIISGNIINYTMKSIRRIDLEIPAAYNAEVEFVKSVLYEIANNHELIFKEPSPIIRLLDYKASSLNYVFRVWCNTSDYWNVRFDIIETIVKVFNEKGISIPFNQYDVHLINKD